MPSSGATGAVSPRIEPKKRLLTVATCFTSCANVRTPAKLPFVGANEYLSSGMACAAPTNSRSTIMSWKSRTEVTVGGPCGAGGRPPPCCAEPAVPASKLHSSKTPTPKHIFMAFPPWFAERDLLRPTLGHRLKGRACQLPRPRLLDRLGA